MKLRIALPVLLVLFGVFQGAASGGTDENAAQKLSRVETPSRDVGDPGNKALYCVGYAHLDTQWRWDFVTTIDEYIRSTLDDNFALFEKYPEYVFNFTGSVRYEMMREYYPERYEKLKQYIKEGRWFVSGSSVDEGDVNVPSPESIIRQVLYGNLYFKREFGKVSSDYMLPDCFGFPASMPSIWAHCGLLGFSTQKLTWGSAVGIPFPVGVWEGLDGSSVLAALDPGPYVGGIKGRVDQNSDWFDRVNQNGKMYGLWADYHYYGVGDQGGAPREDDVRNYIASASADDKRMDVVLASSEQLFQDATPEIRERLPRYRGDMLLTEHSAGTLTSQSYMKRWNRQAEQLADAAERAATIGNALGTMAYPRQKLERAWVRLLANQMHDILPGTSIPRAYRYSWNDDVIALNQFAHVLTSAVGRVSSQMDTRVEGTPIVVFNPLAIDRSDVVEAELELNGGAYVRVFDPNGSEVPSQIVGRDGNTVQFLFVAKVPANGFAVFDVREADSPFGDGRGPKSTDKLIENETYRVTLNDAGDIAQIHDKINKRDLLAKPATLEFTHEKPRSFPAWNMDWADRKNPPVGCVDGTPQWRIVESGPVRATIAVTRWARDSKLTQYVRLYRDDPGRVVEVASEIDWQSTQCALKAAFPLGVSNSKATYNWGAGTIQRGNNEPVKYEVPSHEWFDLTDAGGDYGVTILEDSKFGSDKPADNEVRLTLLYTPGVRNSYMDQHSQDWGVHKIRYGLFGHPGDSQAAGSEWRGRRFNQPLRAFAIEKHEGSLGREFSFGRCDSQQIDIRAMKLAEERDRIIVRVQELTGKPATGVKIEFPGSIETVEEVDGQERVLDSVSADGHALAFDLDAFQMKSFAIKLGPIANAKPSPVHSTPIEIPFDSDVVSLDIDRTNGSMDAQSRTYPGEVLPQKLVDNGVEFRLGPSTPNAMQALACRGQQIDLGNAQGNEVHILAAATEDVSASFRVGDVDHQLGVQAWTGFVGQWYDRVFDRKFAKADFKCEGKVVSILPAYTKRDPIAWFASHRHDPAKGNEAYQFVYIYHYVLPQPESGAAGLTLPHDDRIRIFAVTVANGVAAQPAAMLYDDFVGAKPIAIRHQYAGDKARVFEGATASATVGVSRVESFEQQPMGGPRSDDDIDASTGKDFAFEVFAPRRELEIHPGSGAVDGKLPRLNDGEVAQHDDDTSRCVWYDNEGRFTLDLKSPRRVQRIDTYSWHVANRAPQFFSVWGSAKSEKPDPDFKSADTSDWELIAVVDTRPLGGGGVHTSRIEKVGETLGPYQHLLWVCEDIGQGTFLTEIDIDFADDKP
ncbi:MAG: alpha-mannosidase [Phycisphaerales bacterium]|nr:alpha-mannosidase [Phycisphaerales bacterium]